MRGGTSTMQFCMAKQDSMFHQWWAVRIQSTVSLSGTVETSFSYTMKLFSMRTRSCSVKLSQAWKIMLTWLLAAVAFPVWTSVQQNIVGVVLLAFVLIWQTQGLNLTWIWLILKHWLFLKHKMLTELLNVVPSQAVHLHWSFHLREDFT